MMLMTMTMVRTQSRGATWERRLLDIVHLNSEVEPL